MTKRKATSLTDRQLVALMKFRSEQLRQTLSRLHGIKRHLAKRHPAFFGNVELPRIDAAKDLWEEIRAWEEHQDEGESK